ncbi:MAG: hypothetical protein ACLGHG_06870 [Gammaproteobacteria bacterium]
MEEDSGKLGDAIPEVKPGLDQGPAAPPPRRPRSSTKAVRPSWWLTPRTVASQVVAELSLTWMDDPNQCGQQPIVSEYIDTSAFFELHRNLQLFVRRKSLRKNTASKALDRLYRTPIRQRSTIEHIEFYGAKLFRAEMPRARYSSAMECFMAVSERNESSGLAITMPNEILIRGLTPAARKKRTDFFEELFCALKKDDIKNRSDRDLRRVDRCEKRLVSLFDAVLRSCPSGVHIVAADLYVRPPEVSSDYDLLYKYLKNMPVDDVMSALLNARSKFAKQTLNSKKNILGKLDWLMTPAVGRMGEPYITMWMFFDARSVSSAKEAKDAANKIKSEIKREWAVAAEGSSFCNTCFSIEVKGKLPPNGCISSGDIRAVNKAKKCLFYLAHRWAYCSPIIPEKMDTYWSSQRRHDDGKRKNDWECSYRLFSAEEIAEAKKKLKVEEGAVNKEMKAVTRAFPMQDISGSERAAGSEPNEFVDYVYEQQLKKYFSSLVDKKAGINDAQSALDTVSRKIKSRQKAELQQKDRRSTVSSTRAKRLPIEAERHMGESIRAFDDRYHADSYSQREHPLVASGHSISGEQEARNLRDQNEASQPFHEVEQLSEQQNQQGFTADSGEEVGAEASVIATTDGQSSADSDEEPGRVSAVKSRNEISSIRKKEVSTMVPFSKRRETTVEEEPEKWRKTPGATVGGSKQEFSAQDTRPDEGDKSYRDVRSDRKRKELSAIGVSPVRRETTVEARLEKRRTKLNATVDGAKKTGSSPDNLSDETD